MTARKTTRTAAAKSAGGLARAEQLTPEARAAIAQKGGVARARKLTGKQRSASAIKAVTERWRRWRELHGV